jgi:hypothetical protein
LWNVPTTPRLKIDQKPSMENSLAAIAATNLEEMKLKVRYVDLDCIIGLDEQIGKLPASIVRDLLAIGAKPKALASKEVASDTSP